MGQQLVVLFWTLVQSNKERQHLSLVSLLVLLYALTYAIFFVPPPPLHFHFDPLGCTLTFIKTHFGGFTFFFYILQSHQTLHTPCIFNVSSAILCREPAMHPRGALVLSMNLLRQYQCHPCNLVTIGFNHHTCRRWYQYVWCIHSR